MNVPLTMQSETLLLHSTAGRRRRARGRDAVAVIFVFVTTAALVRAMPLPLCFYLVLADATPESQR